MKVYYDQDADLNLLKDKTVAIIGYGSQGHAHAQNLRDSGVKVVVGQRPGGANYELAKEHGFTPVSAAEAAAQADLIMILLPDEVQSSVYENDIKPHLTKGKALLFAHGFNIHFCQIQPPKDVDVFLIAPKGPGHLVRRTYTEGGGVPCLVAIHQDATGNALKMGLAYAKGIGGARSGRNTDATHPRSYGNNARILGHYVRDLKLLTLEEAIRRMTSLPAQTFRLPDRGVLEPGAFADIVLFNPDKVADPATFTDPHRFAEGFSTVIVNGGVVLQDARLTGKRSGGPLRAKPRQETKSAE